ncbi:MAG: Membrane protein insertase YidC, partial [Pseudomonadota bacterium]
MNDIRRTILWVIFGFSMVLLWDQWQLSNGHKATFFPKPEAAAPASTAAPAATASNNSVPTATTTAPAATPAQVPTSGPNAAASARETIEVVTDVLKLNFDTEGGSLVRTEFTRHADFVDSSKPFVLLDQSSSRVYNAQTGLIGGDFPTHKSPMKFSGERSLKDGQNELTLRFESDVQNGVKLVKTYTLQRGSYAIGVKHEVVNTGSTPVSPQLYLQ